MRLWPGAVLIFCFCVSCYGGMEFQPDQVTSIQYGYTDSSTPPRFHRSYVIVVTPGSAKITVDSYGKVLAQKEDKISAEQFKQLVEAINKSQLGKIKAEEQKGCTGGTQEKISISSNNKSLFAGSVYHCGGRDYGDIAGDLDSVAGRIRALIPEFQQLLNTPYE